MSLMPNPVKLSTLGTESVDVYTQHYKHLCQNYNEELEEIDSMIGELEKEKEIFYRVTLPQMQKRIHCDSFLSKQEKKDAIEEIRKNAEKSFRISEELIQHYRISSPEEFRKELIQAANRL